MVMAYWPGTLLMRQVLNWTKIARFYVHSTSMHCLVSLVWVLRAMRECEKCLEAAFY